MQRDHLRAQHPWLMQQGEVGFRQTIKDQVRLGADL
jgi:hypothetical protein